MAEVINFELLNRITGEEGFLWQYDYGQKMKFSGVELPMSYTVHFANSSTGDSIPAIGDSTGVSIPDQVLQSGKTVYFWLFLHPDANSGQTVYANMIRVHPRTAIPTIEPPTPEEQSILDQLMAALEAGIAHVEDEASNVAHIAEGIPQQINDALAEAKASGEFKGDPGAVFTPEVDGQGILSWENNGGLPNPTPADLKQILDLSAYERKEDLAADIGKGQARGVAELDDAGKVPSSQLPSYVDDVVEYTSVSQFPNPGESGKIYISTSNNHQYRWTGSQYIDISYVDVTGKADKRDTVLETTLSRGRVEGSTAGEASFAFGRSVTASGDYSHAEGFGTTASGDDAHAEGGGTIASGNYSHAEGGGTLASGSDAHAEGGGTQATGESSHAEGGGTHATGNCSHTEGGGTTASGNDSHAEGSGSNATGYSSHAEGGGTTASNDGAHSEGGSTTASGSCSHAEGGITIASGDNSHAEGVGGTVSRGDYTETSEAGGYASHTEGYQTRVFASGSTEIYGGHAEGHQTRASSQAAHAEGNDTYADGTASHSEGYGTRSQGHYSHAEGNQTHATGNFSHSEGYQTESRSPFSHAEGISTIAVSEGCHAEGLGGSYTNNGIAYYSMAVGNYSHTEGVLTATDGVGAHAEGGYTLATGNYAHAEGNYTKASYYASHAEGASTEATNYATHAEGCQTKATGYAAHSEGYDTKATAYCSHAEGYQTEASDSFAHSEGHSTKASRAFSHAEGQYTEAAGTYSHTEGFGTKAVGEASHVGGKYNYVDDHLNWPDWVAGQSYAVGAKVRRWVYTEYVGYICATANSDQSWDSTKWSQDFDFNYVEIIGNGTENSHSNARALDWDGNERLKSDLYVHCNSDSSGGIKIEPVTYMTLADAQAIINNYGVSA